MLKRMVEIIDQYNYDNSDSQTDYYDVNFALNLGLGKWNKAFEDFKRRERGRDRSNLFKMWLSNRSRKICSVL